MIKPFGRIGGKFRVVKELITYIPTDIKYYIEPFFGGGSVFFEREKDPNVIEVINDLDSDVYKILKGLQNRAKYINDNIKRSITAKYFNSIKDKNDVISLLERYKTSFNSIGNIYSKRPNKPRTIKLDFLPYKERLKNVIILNEDYRDVINNFNYKDAFFYLDPPYEVAIDNLKYYKHHSVYPSDILKICKTIKGRFLLSYNDSANIRKLFKDFYIYELKIAYNTNKDTNLIKTELLITNYTLS
jgi:DNA adenine methylase